MALESAEDGQCMERDVDDRQYKLVRMLLVQHAADVDFWSV